MASVIWLIAAFLIFWLATMGALSWVALKLLQQQRTQSSAELTRQENLFETQLEEQRSLFQQQLQDSRSDSVSLLGSERERTQALLTQQEQMVAEAIKQATFGTSSANQTLSDLIKRLIPILAAKEPMAAGQLSTLTDPAEERRVLAGTPYDAEDDAVLASIDEALGDMAQRLTEAGIDPDTARRQAGASIFLPR